MFKKLLNKIENSSILSDLEEYAFMSEEERKEKKTVKGLVLNLAEEVKSHTTKIIEIPIVKQTHQKLIEIKSDLKKKDVLTNEKE